MMAKTCRTCRRIYPLWRCTRPDVFDAEPTASHDCHEPRETPLLVDELAKMVRTLSDPKAQGLDRAAYASLMDEADYVLERYQEEVGDAEVC